MGKIQKKPDTEHVTEKKKKKTGRDLRSKIIMTCLCVAMLGGATFAWFSVSNTPRVNNLALVAGTSGDLKIANTEAGPYGDELDLSAGDGGNMKDVKLNPATTQNGRDFYAPVYTENTVTGVENIPSDKLNTNYVYEKTFYLKAETANTTSSRTRKYDIQFLGIRSDGGGKFFQVVF